MKIGIITQARMTSSRLPGKILREVEGIPLLTYHVQRLKATGFDLALATTINNTDDPVETYAGQMSVDCYRGSENNVLSRFYETALKFNYDVIVRVTSDCPLIDPHLIRNGVEKYISFNNPNLYLSNVLERTFARGFDFEVFSFKLLQEAFEHATEPSDLEHVTPYINRNKSGNTEFYHVKQTSDNAGLRITVDTAEDFELLRTLIEDYRADTLDYHSIEQLLNAHPELVAINSAIVQKKH